MIANPDNHGDSRMRPDVDLDLGQVEPTGSSGASPVNKHMSNSEAEKVTAPVEKYASVPKLINPTWVSSDRSPLRHMCWINGDMSSWKAIWFDSAIQVKTIVPLWFFPRCKLLKAC